MKKEKGGEKEELDKGSCLRVYHEEELRRGIVGKFMTMDIDKNRLIEWKEECLWCNNVGEKEEMKLDANDNN